MYKKIKLIALLIAISFAFGCDDDSDADALVLSLDGDNLSSPFFDANATHEASVRFPSNLTSIHIDKSVTSVRVYINTVPNSLSINIYGAGSSTSPGSLLHTQSINTSALRSNNSWYTFPLDEAIAITGDDLWVGASVQYDQRAGIIGCDPGPAVSGGDWYKLGTGSYQTFRNSTGGNVSINWNIRANMEINE